jgi:ketosteroid isomerase-like protein
MQQTTAEHPNATLVRRGMEAFNRGEMEAMDAFIADDVVWHQIGRETVRGKDALASASPGGDVDWQITADVHDVVANDDHAIALVEATATRPDGRTLTYRTAEIMHIRDGKLTERWAFAEDTQKIIDFFA